MDAGDRDDPLVLALPPASDYLTYLTIIEYQLTPARLPLLHRLLQDETLTSHIGWDLVQLLVPLLPASEPCLQDVARLGNPKEVIVRVADALMKLQPSEDEEDSSWEEAGETEAESKVGESAQEDEIPLHITQFKCLVGILPTLHSRLRAKRPSLFIATSLQAVLEAYTEYPTIETTTAMIGFLRDIYGSKRPALPPRNRSEQPTTAAPSGVLGDDPEGVTEADGPSLARERDLIQKLVQFGLLEVLKAYLLHCTSDNPPGMQWALRVYDKIDSSSLPSAFDLIEHFEKTPHAKERDVTVGKIIALSRDFGLETDELLQVVLKRSDAYAAPLDLENLPDSPSQITLERHGCLILLAARYTTAVLFDSSQTDPDLALYPDISRIFSNFLITKKKGPEETAAEAPVPLLDSLLVLALLSHECHLDTTPKDYLEFSQLILAMVACTRARDIRQLSRIDKIPSRIFHSNPNDEVRYNLIHQIFNDENLQYARESALGWLKTELLSNPAEHNPANPFIDPSSFAELFRAIYKSLPDHYLSPSALPTPVLLTEWVKFISQSANFYMLALNFYYLLCKSEYLREKLELQALHPEFTENFLRPVKNFAGSIYNDVGIGERVDHELYEDIVRMGRSAADVVLHVIQNIELVDWRGNESE